MHEDFAQIFEFYVRCGPDATGHNLINLEGEEADLIERFIQGHCNESERRQLAQVLQSRPDLIRQIAERVKTTREVAEDSTQASSP